MNGEERTQSPWSFALPSLILDVVAARSGMSAYGTKQTALTNVGFWGQSGH